MNKTKIVFKRKLQTIRFVYGVGLSLIGIVLLFSGNLLGILSLVIAILFFNKDGSGIDLETKKYRTFIELYGVRFGKWKEFPKIEYVSVFSATESAIIRASSADARIESDVIVVNLFYNGNHRIKACITKSKDEVFKIAKQIARILKIYILDATEVESEWI
jgi:hypothetical protein